MNDIVKGLYRLHNCETVVRDIPDEEGCVAYYIQNVFNGVPQQCYEYCIKRDMLYVLNATDVEENYHVVPKEARRLAVVIDIILKTLQRNLAVENLRVESEIIKDTSIIAFFKPPTDSDVIEKENALKKLLNDLLVGDSSESYIKDNNIEQGHEYLLNLVNNGGF